MPVELHQIKDTADKNKRSVFAAAVRACFDAPFPGAALSRLTLPRQKTDLRDMVEEFLITREIRHTLRRLADWLGPLVHKMSPQRPLKGAVQGFNIAGQGFALLGEHFTAVEPFPLDDVIYVRGGINWAPTQKHRFPLSFPQDLPPWFAWSSASLPLWRGTKIAKLVNFSLKTDYPGGLRLSPQGIQATDGHRLVHFPVDVPVPQVLHVPGAYIDHLHLHVAGADKKFWYMTDRGFGPASGFDMNDVWKPEEVTIVIEFDVLQLRDVLISDELVPRVRLTLADDAIRAGNVTVGSWVRNPASELAGLRIRPAEPEVIAFDPKYLQDMLDTAGAGIPRRPPKKIIMETAHILAPARFYDPARPDFDYLLMPMRLD